MKTVAVVDTHVAMRYMIRPDRLTRGQLRFLRQAVADGNTLGLSAMSLIELAHLDRTGRVDADLVFQEIERQDILTLFPITAEIARQSAAFAGALRDPADCVIAATALVHNVPLVTSDQRIIDSRVVPTVS